MENIWTNLTKVFSASLLLIVFTTLSLRLSAQPSERQTDAAFIRKIYDQALTDGRCYPWLRDLCLGVGHRLSGSPGAEKAVKWTQSMLDTVGLDSVWLQPVMVPHWVRGSAEQVRATGSKKYGSFNINALALGGSVGTNGKAVSAEVVEVKTWEELDALNERGIRGKIVFYNRPMDPAKIRTFEAYGGAVDQRSSGASRAAKYGAVGVLVRSMNLRLDDFPHTGALRYDSTYTLIPAVAISTNDAEKLSALLHAEGKATVSMQLNCQTFPDVLSYNVIGEIRGR